MEARFDWRRLHDPTLERCDNYEHRARLLEVVLSDPRAKEDGRRVTQNNLLALSWVLGYTLIDEEVHHEALGFFPPKNPNLSLNEWIKETNQEYKRLGSLLLPRGVYKTTLNIANCVQLLICWPLTVSIMIMCGRSDLAEDFVGQVSSFFWRPKHAPPTLFQALWLDLTVEKKPDGKGFTTARRQTDPKIIEPAIWGESIEAGTSGYHPNILITDDIHNNRNSRKFESRVGITKKYKLAKKVLLPLGSEYRIGTIYGQGDIFTDEILTMRPDTVRRIIKPAIRLRSGERLDFNGFPEEDELELFFPTILTYDFLRAEYEADPDTFFSQYMLDEYGAGEVVFSKEQMLKAMVPESALPLEGEIIIHWRLACMKHVWMTSACAVGQIHRNRCYILEIYDGEYKPSVLGKMMVNTARKYNTHRVNIEASPGAINMVSAIQNYARTTGWKLYIDWSHDEQAENEENKGERDLRIRSLEAVLATGRLYFFAGMRQYKKLLTEFIQYGMCPDDGLPDVISRVADHLPQSSEAEEEDEALAWEAMKERDHHNLIFGRGAYAPVEPEPEELETPEFEEPFNSQGLEVWLPGLE